MVDQNEIEFYFAPGCPWAWRTALWARNVAIQRPLQITWKCFSLSTVNSANPNYPQAARTFGYKSEQLMVAAGRHGGNDAVERIYMALGDAIHGKREERTDAVFTSTLAAAGLPASLLADVENDPSIEKELLKYTTTPSRSWAPSASQPSAFPSRISPSSGRSSTPCQPARTRSTCGITSPGRWTSPTYMSSSASARAGRRPSAWPTLTRLSSL